MRDDRFQQLWYILDENRKPVPCESDAAFAWRRKNGVHVDRTAIDVTGLGTIVISTVFLGLDHNYDDGGPPILFETMVFRNGSGEECERFATWDEAVKGHADMVAEVKRGLARMAEQASKS